MTEPTITPEHAAEKAAAALAQAQQYAADFGRAAALVAVADGWTRLHAALAVKSGTPAVHIESMTATDADAELIGKLVERRLTASRARATKQEPEIGVYSERARLIAYLAAEQKAKIAYNDPDEPDWPVIYVETSRGQLSWHLSPDDLHLFPHVPIAGRHIPLDQAPEWDGHTTAEKYERLAAATQDAFEGIG